MNEPSKPLLSAEDAELFASKIRPSWELVDDSVRDELAADLAAPAPSAGGPGSAPDTVIQGIPTVSIGDPVADAPAAEAPANDGARPAHANGNGNGAAAGAPRAAGVGATLVDAEPPAPPVAMGGDPPYPPPRPPPARGGKTQMGLGNEAARNAAAARSEAPAAPAAPAAPSSRRAVRAAPAAPASAPVQAQAPAGKTQPDDDIQIPVNAPPGLALKIGVGAVALIGVAAIVFGVMGGSKKTDAETTPVAAPTAAAPTQAPSATAAAAPQPAASAAPTAAKEPEPKKAAEPPPEPKKAAEPAPEPKKAAEPPPEPKKAEPPPKPEPKKAAEPPPKKAAEPKKAAAPAPAPPPKKGGGGIIRETPF